MPTASVVLLNWNGAHLLPTCLASLRAQSRPPAEIIMPDNGSTDGSLELVARRYPEVRVIRFPRNMGFCLAMNAGMEASHGEFILSLNNDTELDQHCLHELVSAMRSDPGLGMCAPKMIYYDDPGLINSAGHACGPDGVVVDIGRGQRDGKWFRHPREVLGACAGAALYRREMLAQVGLFDPDFFISYEDADLSWRAQWAGWRARYVPTAVVRHREGVSRGIRSRRAVFLGMRNSVHVWTKDWPLSSLWHHLPAIWRGWRAAALELTRRGEAGVVAAATWDALAQTPRMLNRRRRIGRSRSVAASRFEALLEMGRHHTRGDSERREESPALDSGGALAPPPACRRRNEPVPTRILAISLVPPETFARILRAVRDQYPEGELVALLGSEGRYDSADEVMLWRSSGARRLIKELRRRRPDLVVVAHGGDQCLTRAYWKAVLLALLAGARQQLLWRDTCRVGMSLHARRQGATPAVRACSKAGFVLRAAGQAVAQLAAEAYVAATGLLLAPILAAVAITDITEYLARAGRLGPPRGQRERRSVPRRRQTG